MVEKQIRKRGEKLDNKIFQVVIDLLKTQTYEEVTYTLVAQEAHTSRTVLYRRWSTMIELMHDAVNWKVHNVSSSRLHGAGGQIAGMINDESIVGSNGSVSTGNLRDDLIEMSENFWTATQIVGPEYMRAMMIEYGRSNPYLQKLVPRARQINLDVVNRILMNALERGEIKQVPSENVRMLFFDLTRYRMMMNQNIITSQEDLTQIIDEVVMPSIMAAQ